MNVTLSADMCAGKFPLVSMEGRVEGLACAYPGARTPISASGIFSSSSELNSLYTVWKSVIKLPTVSYFQRAFLTTSNKE